MVFFLKLILFIFLAGVFALALFAVRIYLTIRRAKQQFRERQQDFSDAPQGEYGERITDTKARERSQRKIIADDEGEYVDFEEVK